MWKGQRGTETDTRQAPLEFSVPEGSEGLRLDAALSLLWPGSGLRARRRLWGWCRMYVNGRPRPPGYTVVQGDSVRIEPEAESGEGFPGLWPSAAAGPRAGCSDGADFPFALCALSENYAALCKPAGLHSAHIAGGAGQSLESLLPAVWPFLVAAYGNNTAAGGAEAVAEAQASAAPPFLLTRLDRDTTGLVLAARNSSAAECFRRWERAGQVEKTYFALVRGYPPGPLVLRNRLLVADRRLTRVLEEDDADMARHTLAEPLRRIFLPDPWPGGTEGALLLVRIGRGARHQIRAHLAHAGYPLAGERQYAPPPPAPCPLFLHHAMIRFPDFAVRTPPVWGDTLCPAQAWSESCP